MSRPIQHWPAILGRLRSSRARLVSSAGRRRVSPPNWSLEPQRAGGADDLHYDPGRWSHRLAARRVTQANAHRGTDSIDFQPGLPAPSS